MIKFLDLYYQYSLIKEEIDYAIAQVIKESAFIKSIYVEEFEENFAKYQDTKYCVGVGNGTDALELAIEALEISVGSEIIVPANSFIASSEAVTRMGCKVIFADIDMNTYNVCVEDVKNKITSKTKAIIAVHLYGQPCELNTLKKISTEYNLYLIEDCAQAHGALYQNQKVGSIGDIGTFSFYPGKVLGAFGDGGAVTTNNFELCKKIKMISDHGRLDKYNHEFEGRNSRLDGLQAAVLNVKLKYLDEWIDLRNQIAKQYNKLLNSVSQIQLPKILLNLRSSYHLFVIQAQNRDQLKAYLEQNEIQTGIHYPIALPKLLPYKQQYINSNFSATLLNNSLLSLPIGEHLNSDNIQEVCENIINFYA